MYFLGFSFFTYSPLKSYQIFKFLSFFGYENFSFARGKPLPPLEILFASKDVIKGGKRYVKSVGG